MKRSCCRLVMIVLLGAWVTCPSCASGGSGWRARGGKARTTSTGADTALASHVMEGTVAQFATLIGGGDQIVHGYGLTVGLAGNGSSEAPLAVRRSIATDMMRQGIGKIVDGKAPLKPSRLIDDKDTAVVTVKAGIPPGAPKGAVIDAYVCAIQGSQTRSLDGGILFNTELKALLGTKKSRALASVKGEVFVNPFIDERDPAVTSRLREGRIIGGGVTLKARPLRLVLNRPDYRLANVIQERINDKFSHIPRVANARNSQFISVSIPPRYRRDYGRFL